MGASTLLAVSKEEDLIMPLGNFQAVALLPHEEYSH